MRPIRAYVEDDRLHTDVMELAQLPDGHGLGIRKKIWTIAQSRLTPVRRQTPLG